VNRPTYSSGEIVRIGDVVDVEGGRGTLMRVVVIIETDEAAAGFSAADWQHVGKGIVLQDKLVFGLLHLEEMNSGCIRLGHDV
jgi:hypothetical protein